MGKSKANGVSYSDRIADIKARNGPEKAILELFKDRGLKALDKRLLANCCAFNSMPVEDFADPVRSAAYWKAHNAFSRSPRKDLIVLFHRLPLVRQYPLARKSREIEKLFIENLNDKDKESQPAAKIAKVDGKKADGLPHPLVTILKRSTKGGGALGEIKLANELNQYCTDQLTAFYENPLNFGLVNAVGVLLTLFKPRKVDDLLKIAYQLRGKKQIYSFVTPGDIRNFLRKPATVAHLKGLKQH